MSHPHFAAFCVLCERNAYCCEMSEARSTSYRTNFFKKSKFIWDGEKEELQLSALDVGGELYEGIETSRQRRELSEQKTALFTFSFGRYRIRLLTLLSSLFAAFVKMLIFIWEMYSHLSQYTTEASLVQISVSLLSHHHDACSKTDETKDASYN